MRSFLFMFCLLITVSANAEIELDQLSLHKVEASHVEFKGKSAIRVVEAARTNEEDKVVILPNSRMKNGSISAYVSGGLNKEAGEGARGFVGIAFRIADDVSTFEAIYLRPTNARAESQLRRNHSIQYISHPDFPWYRLRKETPAKYESYADMLPSEWIHYRLDVSGATARLYLNNAPQPSLIVTDLKLGEKEGDVGLWIGPGTEAHFSNVSVKKK